MIAWVATIFLSIALLAAVLGFTGIAGIATRVVWMLFVVGLILAVVLAVTRRRNV